VTVRDDLVDAALGRAREARGELAQTLPDATHGSAETEGARRTLTRTIGALYATEMGEMGLLQEALTEALDGLRALRDALPELKAAGITLGEPSLDRLEQDLIVPRDALRRALEAPRMTIPVDTSTENNFFTGFGEDVTDGGVFVATYDVLPVGESMRVEIRLRGEDPILTEAVVKWVRQAQPEVPPGMGLSLPDLGPEERHAVERFMRRREPLFHDD
jgi:uncharacterized protein (TIGR02266 family)